MTNASRGPVTSPGIRAPRPIVAAGPRSTAARTPTLMLASSVNVSGRRLDRAGPSTNRSTPASR